MTDVKPTDDNWGDDKCERKPTADFLYRLVMSRYSRHHSGEDSRALCVALDAQWGAGKSFFVNRWSRDVEDQDHLVVRFDAWKNDLSDDPLIAFLSNLHDELAPWIKRLPIANRVRQNTKQKFSKVMQQGRKAVVPALGALARGAVNRYAPGALEEISAIITDDLRSKAPSQDLATDMKSIAGPALEKFLELTIKSHSDRQTAVAGLKASIDTLLSYLSAQRQTQLPMFVFVDELDRCRPDYAVRLLEGVKHLFDAPGVCFIFSTNLKQLAASTQAIYGASFDAPRYLKRFFNFEYLLPTASPVGLAAQLTAASDIVARGLPVFDGLPPPSEATTADRIARSFVFVAQAFDLNPRSQKQVFEYADAATVAISEPAGSSNWAIHTLYLFFLAALLHEGGVEVFDDFITADKADHANRISKLAGKAGVRGDFAYAKSNVDGQQSKARMTSAEWFVRYTEYSKMTKRELAKREPNTLEFPGSVISRLTHEQIHNSPFSSIHTYAALIRTAGGVKVNDAD